jgi:hypothetical protein
MAALHAVCVAQQRQKQNTVLVHTRCSSTLLLFEYEYLPMQVKMTTCLEEKKQPFFYHVVYSGCSQSLSIPFPRQGTTSTKTIVVDPNQRGQCRPAVSGRTNPVICSCGSQVPVHSNTLGWSVSSRRRTRTAKRL